jgi:hypothetical protein
MTALQRHNGGNCDILFNYKYYLSATVGLQCGNCTTAGAVRRWQWQRLCDGGGGGKCERDGSSGTMQWWQLCNVECAMAAAGGVWVTAAVATATAAQRWRLRTCSRVLIGQVV